MIVVIYMIFMIVYIFPEMIHTRNILMLMETDAQVSPSANPSKIKNRQSPSERQGRAGLFLNQNLWKLHSYLPPNPQSDFAPLHRTKKGEHPSFCNKENSNHKL